MTNKIIKSLAHFIELKIAHPEQRIFQTGDPFQFQILKRGEVGYFVNSSRNKITGIPFDRIKVSKNGDVRLLNLQIFPLEAN